MFFQGRRQVDELSLVIPEEAGALQAYPQIAVSVRGKSKNRSDSASRIAKPLDRQKIQAVKTEQALLRSDPQIPVGGLRQSVDRAAEKPILTAPMVASILR